MLIDRECVPERDATIDRILRAALSGEAPVEVVERTKGLFQSARVELRRREGQNRLWVWIRALFG